MQGVRVHVGIDRHGMNPQLLTGAHDADGDFAAIGNQQFLDRFHSMKVEEICYLNFTVICNIP